MGGLLALLFLCLVSSARGTCALTRISAGVDSLECLLTPEPRAVTIEQTCWRQVLLASLGWLDDDRTAHQAKINNSDTTHKKEKGECWEGRGIVHGGTVAHHSVVPSRVLLLAAAARAHSRFRFLSRRVRNSFAVRIEGPCT